MISYIKGTIIDIDFSYVTVLTSGGVGYDVLINELTFSKLVKNNDIELFIYHYRTENLETLFGFLENDEKIVFSEIIKISGVGGKVGLSILSIGLNNLFQAINNEDSNMIQSIKGIGKKMSEKIILEMKDKKFNINTIDLGIKKEKSPINLSKDLTTSIKETLVNMGYNYKQVENVLQNLPEDLEREVGVILPYLIKELS